jgi:hypothetical protein
MPPYVQHSTTTRDGNPIYKIGRGPAALGERPTKHVGFSCSNQAASRCVRISNQYILNTKRHPKVKYHVFTPTNTEFAVSIKPKVALATYQGGAFSGYSQPNGAVWLDCNNPGIQHFGLKGAVDNFTDSTIDIQVSIKIWVEFRDPL